MEDFASGAVEFSETRRSNDGGRANPPAGTDREGNADRPLFATGACGFRIELVRLDLRNQQGGVARARHADVDGPPIRLADMLGIC
jgi:hypothetical protein